MSLIADRLRALRANRGLTVRGLAMAVSAAGFRVSRSSVSQYERGTAVPAAYLAALSRALSVDAHWLLHGDDAPGCGAGPPVLEDALRRIVTLADDLRGQHGSPGAYFDTYLRIGPDLFGVLDGTGVIRSLSQGWTRVLGVPVEHLVGKSYAEFVHLDDRAPAEAVLRSVMGGLPPQSGESRVGCPGQAYRWVAWTAAGDGSFAFFLARDVTDARRSRALAETLQVAMETSADCVVVMDADGVLQYVNRAFVETTGYTSDEATGRTLAILQPSPDAPALPPPVLDTLRAGRPYRGIMVHRRKDGSLYYDSRTISPICGPDGTLTGLVSTGRAVPDEIARPLVQAGVLPTLPEGPPGNPSGR
jgi:PAS domain S-box-containing protein